MPPAELAALRAAYAHCAVDVGTGDAHFAYHLASERPDWLVIGLDALDEPMGEIAYKAAAQARARRPSESGAVARRDRSASGRARADRGRGRRVAAVGRVARGHRARRVRRSSAASRRSPRRARRCEVTLNGEIWLDSTPARYEDLPVPTPEYVAEAIEPEFRRAGIDLEPARLPDGGRGEGAAHHVGATLGSRSSASTICSHRRRAPRSVIGVVTREAAVLAPTPRRRRAAHHSKS